MDLSKAKAKIGDTVEILPSSKEAVHFFEAGSKAIIKDIDMCSYSDGKSDSERASRCAKCKIGNANKCDTFYYLAYSIDEEFVQWLHAWQFKLIDEVMDK